MASHNIAEKNGMWKGGRSTASNGYVLVRVGRDHHLGASDGEQCVGNSVPPQLAEAVAGAAIETIEYEPGYARAA